jgi:hypothetical protein
LAYFPKEVFESFEKTFKACESGKDTFAKGKVGLTARDASCKPMLVDACGRKSFVTFPSIRYIIDTGLVKLRRVQWLNMEWIAQKNIQLRKGCSGRVIQGDY